MPIKVNCTHQYDLSVSIEAVGLQSLLLGMLLSSPLAQAAIEAMQEPTAQRLHVTLGHRFEPDYYTKYSLEVGLFRLQHYSESL